MSDFIQYISLAQILAESNNRTITTVPIRATTDNIFRNIH